MDTANTITQSVCRLGCQRECVEGFLRVWRWAIWGKGTGVVVVRASRASIGDLCLYSDDFLTSEEGFSVHCLPWGAGGFG